MTQEKHFVTKSWKQLKKPQFFIFNEGFVHQKVFTFKVNKQTNHSKFKFGAYVGQKDGKININDELNLWILLKQGHFAQAGLRKDQFLLQATSRPFKSDSGRSYIFNASYQAKKSLSDAIFKMVMKIKAQNSIRSWRLRLDRDVPGILLEEREEINKDNTCLILYNALDILNSFAWRASALQITWRKSQNCTLQLRSACRKASGHVSWRNFLENVSLDSVYKFGDSTKFGIEINACLWPLLIKNVSALWQYSNPSDIIFKVKGDINRNICFSIRNPIKDYGHYTFGALISDFGRANKISYGLQFDLDI